ncbi:HAD family acid phosphatase [Amycolatopsis orientalis]|uniref:HAD family acid phosphatase n=1 Tax=Amycolatopsis orientalis TaxID=31958 RepID=UPI0003A47952|nr:HAD family acid phosphatase [Amycolatopsis orientalis]
MNVKSACAAILAVAGLIAAPATASASASELPSYDQWQADVREAVDPAIPWLTDRVARGGSGLAIVLDIDNTSLETEYHPGEPNRPVLAVAQWASQHHVSVLFVTARTSSSSARIQLSNAGYPIDAICTRKSGEGTAAGKQRCRADLTEQGYTITANIGNRSTDLEGGDYEKGFKLPDYDGQLS